MVGVMRSPMSSASGKEPESESDTDNKAVGNNSDSSCSKAEFFEFLNWLLKEGDEGGLRKVMKMLRELVNSHPPLALVKFSAGPKKNCGVVELYQWAILAGVKCFEIEKSLPWDDSMKVKDSDVRNTGLPLGVTDDMDRLGLNHEVLTRVEPDGVGHHDEQNSSFCSVDSRNRHGPSQDSLLASAVVSMCERNTEHLLLSGSYKTFNGVNLEEFKSWAKGLTNRVESMKVSDRVKLLHLENCLTGMAHRDFIDNNPSPTWNSAMDYLYGRYTDPYSDSKRMAKFGARFQQANESVADYGRALKFLCPLYPNERLYNSTLIGQLKTGVQSMKFKELVGEAARLGTVSFDDLVAQLSIKEDVGKELYGSGNRNRVNVNQPQGQGGGAHGRMQDNRYNTRQFCVHCGRYGNHVSSQCIQAQNNSAAGSFRVQQGTQGYGNRPPSNYPYRSFAQTQHNNNNWTPSQSYSRQFGPGYQDNRQSSIRCYSCNQQGHKSTVCPNRQGQSHSGTGNEKVRAVAVETPYSRLEKLVVDMKGQIEKVQERLEQQDQGKEGKPGSLNRVGLVRLPVRGHGNVPQKFPVAVKPRLVVEGVVLSSEDWTLDTGSVNTLISKELAVDKLGAVPKPCMQKLLAINDSQVTCLGVVKLIIELAGKSVNTDCFVIEGSNTDLLLGVRFMTVMGYQLVGPDGLDYLPVCDQQPSSQLVARVREKIPLSDEDEEAFFVFQDDEGVPTVVAQVILNENAEEPVTEWEGDDDLHYYCELPSTAQATDQKEDCSRSEFVKDLKLGSWLTDKERTEFEDILWACKDAFSSSYKVGAVQNVQDVGKVKYHHRIDTGDNLPFKMAERRLPYTQRAEVQRMVSDLLEKGLIKETCSPYSSAVVLAKKSDGSWRFCVDYRRLNAQTVKDSYPIGRIDDVLASLGTGRIFTSLDIKCGYYNVPLEPESIPKTAFVANGRVYVWKRMPFGLCNAPATFTRVMKEILSEFEGDFVRVYLDDILIVSQTVEEHKIHVAKVLRTLLKSGLRLNPNKCSFAVPELKYLGHIVSGDGVKVNPAKADAIRNYPIPQTKRQMQSFLGLLNYIRQYLKNLSVRLAPLQKMVIGLDKPKTPLVWTDELKNLFHEVCKECAETPTLSRPLSGCGCEYLLHTDASTVGMGVMLQQRQPDGLRLIEFASRSTSGAERNYAATELEMRAVIFALEHFHVYLVGEKVILFTDHRPLTGLLKKDLPSPKLYRWAMVVQQYDLEIRYVPGKDNVVADSLSRAPRVCRMQTTLQSHEKLRLLKVHHCGKAASHSGVEATYHSLKQFYAEIWPGLKADVQRFVSECDICRQRSSRYEILPPVSRPPPFQPRQVWHLDYSEIRRSSVVKYCLVLIDGFTRWMVVCPTKSQNSRTTLKGLNAVIEKFGVPQTIVSDQGSHFCSQAVQEFLASNKIKHETTTAYAKKANGLIERANRTFQEVLSKRLAEEKRNLNSWYLYAESAAMACNVKPHTSLGFKSPFHVLYGVPYSAESSEFVEKPEMLEFWAETRKQIIQSQAMYGQNRFFDRLESKFKAGDRVFVKSDALRGQRKMKIDLANNVKGVIREMGGRRSALVELVDVPGRFKVHRVPLSFLQPRSQE